MKAEFCRKHIMPYEESESSDDNEEHDNDVDVPVADLCSQGGKWSL